MKITKNELKGLIQECLREELGRKVLKRSLREFAEDDSLTIQDIEHFFYNTQRARVYKENKLALKNALAKLKEYKKDYPELINDPAGFMNFLDELSENNDDFDVAIWTVLDLAAVWGKEALENNLRKYDIYCIFGDQYYIVDPRTDKVVYNFAVSVHNGFDSVIDTRTGIPFGNNNGYLSLANIPD